MEKIRQLLSVGSVVVLFGFLLTILLVLQSNIAAADEIGLLVAESQAGGEKGMVQRKEKNETAAVTKEKEDVQKCIRGRGCMTQPANNEASENGGACSSGIVCSVEGAPCTRAGGQTCKTWDMGGGNCGCVCM